jgi:hypothetical protein
MTPPDWKTVAADGPLDDAKSWFLIPSQDFSSIVRQQKGIRSKGFEAAILSGRQESLILNMHRQIDAWLGG